MQFTLSCRGVAIGILLVALSARDSFGATFAWNSAGTGQWSNGASWAGGVTPPSDPSTDLVFTGNGNIFSQQDVANPFVLNSLNFGSSSSSVQITGLPLRFAADGATPPGIVINSPQTETIDVPIFLDADTTISGVGFITGVTGNFDHLIFRQPINGNFRLTKNNAYLATFSSTGTNTLRRLDTTNGITVFSGGVTNITSNVHGDGLNVASSLTISSGAQLNVNAPGSSSVIIDGANPTLIVTGPGSTLRYGATLQVGTLGASSGRLFVSNGGIVTGSGSFVLGAVARSGNATVSSGATLITGPARVTTGSVTVSDPGSSWTAPDALFGTPQNNGVSRLTITNGGSVTVAGPIQINFGTLGVMNISAASLTTGGLISAAGVRPGVAISDPAGGVALTINGAITSTFDAAISDGTLGPGSITKAGTGTFNLLGNQTYTGTTLVQSGVMTLQNGTNQSRILATGGTLILSNVTLTPGGGFGEMRAQTGATIQYIAGTSVSNGILRGGGQQTIDNARFSGTTFGADAVVTSNGGTLTNVRNAGRLSSVAGTLTINAGSNDASGTLSISNSTVNASAYSSTGVINVTANGRLRQDDVNLTLGGGSRTSIQPTGAIEVAAPFAIEMSGAMLTNHGSIGGITNVRFNSLAIGSGTFGPVNVFDNGVFSPGSSSGATIFSPAAVGVGGDFAMNDAATLRVQIGGAAPATQHDQVNVTGAAALGGVLEIGRGNNFNPQMGQHYVILTSQAGVNGVFQQVTGQEFDATTFLVPVYDTNQVSLTRALPGDATLDGAVNITDFAQLASVFNRSMLNWHAGDFNGDTNVNITDFALMAANFNQTVSAARPFSVPEPTMIMLSPIAALLFRRR